MSDDKKPVPLKVSVDEETALGNYVNFANILHNPTEFVIDFGRVVPGRPEAKILSRVITNPFHAKQILRALESNIAIYERKHGSIAERPADPAAGGDIN